MAGQGRNPGSKNKPKSAMLRMLQQKYGKEFHPIMELAKIANNEDADLTMKFNANKELAQYVVPKLRAIEMSGEVGVTLPAVIRETYVSTSKD